MKLRYFDELTEPNAWYLLDSNYTKMVISKGGKRYSGKAYEPPPPNPFKVPVDPVKKAIDDAVADIGKATQGKGYDNGCKK